MYTQIKPIKTQNQKQYHKKNKGKKCSNKAVSDKKSKTTIEFIFVGHLRQAWSLTLVWFLSSVRLLWRNHFFFESGHQLEIASQ